MMSTLPAANCRWQKIPLLLCFISLLGGFQARGAGFSVNINFQSTNSADVSGYLADVGYVFGDRGNGYAYGWNVDNTSNAFQRTTYPSDPRIETGNKMQPGGQALNWQIEVPNGVYDVLLVAADPSDQGGQGTVYNIAVQAVPDVTGTPGASQWIFGTNTHVQVNVTNRRLAVSNGPGAVNNCICYIQIVQVAPIFWGAGIIDNTGTNKAPWDYVSSSSPGVLGYFEGLSGKALSVIGWGDTWSNANIPSYNMFWWNTNVGGMAGMWGRGTIPSYTWQPSAEPADTTNFSLQNIIAGQQDAYITNWAKQAKAYGKPFFLRFAHEMNGTWYPWSEGIGVSSNAPPGSFTNMWRHVHDIFTRVGCTNATWVWCVNEVSSYDLPGGIAQFYPGDDYVDWLGMDAYNMNANPPGQSFETIFGTTYTNLEQVSPGKPIMICETATLDGGAPPGNSKPTWIADALSQLPTAFPNVRGFVWYNANDVKTNEDYPIAGGGNLLPYWSAPVDWVSVAAWSNGIASPYYLANLFTNQTNLSASPIQPVLIPSPPGSLTAAGANSAVQLTWAAVSSATNYNVYRSTSSSNGTFALLATTTATTNTDRSATNRLMYYYFVTAENLGGESLASTQASIAPLGVVNVTPTNITAVASQGAITLSWPADHIGWELQAQTNGLRPFNWVAVPGSSATDLFLAPIVPGNGSVFYRLAYPGF